ncbi:MAG: glycoside hydrolase family 13 protein [Bacillota bacterium]
MEESRIYHNSYQLLFRTPFGAVPCEESITLRLTIHRNQPVEFVLLRLWINHEERILQMQLRNESDFEQSYEVSFTAPSEPGLIWYYFIIIQGDKVSYYGNNDEKLGGIGCLYSHIPPAYQITVHKRNCSTPNWFKEAVMYQIFVDRFYNGNEPQKILNHKEGAYLHRRWDDIPRYIRDPETNKVLQYDFFGGNLKGIMKKLPYLKELGIHSIYLNPIFESPSNHKYDTGDYKKIDPMFGDLETFQQFCKEAKALGISIILDGVFSHTGSDSIYFNKYNHYPSVGAYQSKASPYFPWYQFINYPEDYDCWWGIDVLPNVNEMEPIYLDFMLYDKDSVVKYWINNGAKGWRLDVADELPDAFIKTFRKTMKDIDKDSILIGEVWEDASNKVSHGEPRQYLFGEELDSVMNYPFRNILIDFILGRKDSRLTCHAFMQLYENYPLHHFYSLMNLLGSHDVPRILTVLGEASTDEHLSIEERETYTLPPHLEKLAVHRLKLLTLVQLTFPGVPCIYYGDEAGLQGHADPLNRRTYPWGHENMALLEWHKKLIRIRNRYDIFKTGEWFPQYLSDDIFGFVRRITNQRDVFLQPRKNNVALVLINRNPENECTLSINVSQWFEQDCIFDILHDSQEILLMDGYLTLTLSPLQGKILMQSP